MEVSGIIDLFFDLMQKLIDTLTGFSFKLYGIQVNPFALAVAMIFIFMVIFSYWKGSRA